MNRSDQQLQRATAASRFVAQSLERHPDWRGDPLLIQVREPGALTDAVDFVIADAGDEAVLMRGLRRLRRRELTRIAVRALGGAADLSETLRDLSELADACCSGAVGWCLARLLERHGQPRDTSGGAVQPVVLGMGKLGGGELNFSSDIDLIFFHTADGETDGAQVLANEQLFVRLAQQVGRVLASVTEDGFVFRVDTLLRPFGSAGPMSISFSAAEDYYQNHGREWERYALIKARPVAGDIAAGHALLKLLRPFVYRRYLDFQAIGSLRDLKRRIHDDVVARRVADDVKLGPGGIREVEFIVQSFQLVRGGHDARLRDPRLRAVLRRLGECGLMPPDTAVQLDAAYVFLRRLENALQMYDDCQTHRLPADAAARTALCVAIARPHWDALRAEYDRTTQFVNQEFLRVFAEQDHASEGSAAMLAAIHAAQGTAVDAATVTQRLVAAGLRGAGESLTQRLIDLLRGHLARGLSDGAMAHLRRVLARSLEAGLDFESPVQTADRVLLVIQAVAGRATYLTLLDESGVARNHLVRLCAASRWIAEQIAASPAALDTLLDPRLLFAPPGREAIGSELAQRLGQIDAADIEAGMDVLRRYRNETTVRIAAADIAGSLPLVKVSDHLTWLAEAVLQAAMDRARSEIEVNYGVVTTDAGTHAALGAVAYGKFGGFELGYGSDLDLVFVYDSVAADAESSGTTRSLPAAAYFARLSQRVIHWLATLTPAGRAYEIDLELRPSGQSGAVAVSLAALARYQLERAWTWEHQALTRARFVGGPARLGEAFDDLRRKVLCREREPVRLAQEILEMRQKMRTHLGSRKAGTWDLKQGEGGVIDCEFLTQYLVLRDACRHPALVQWPDNWRQLDALADSGSIARADKDRLIECYRVYRAFAHARALQSEVTVTEEGAFAAERESVKAIWNRHLG